MTLITYVNPAVAIVLGALVLNEPLTMGLAIGFPLRSSVRYSEHGEAPHRRQKLPVPVPTRPPRSATRGCDET